MAVRQIEYTVYADRLEPSVRHLGGMQGDHKATEVLFEISGSLYKILKEQAESTNGRLIYRFDGYDGAGGVHSSDTKELPAENGEELLVKLKYPLEEWITRYGGQIKVVLVISLLKDDSTEMELYSYPAVCQFKNRPFGTPAPGENHESISTLAQCAKESAEIAVRAKDEAIAAQIKAEENAEEVIGRIEPLEADVEGLKQSSVTKDYVDSHLEGVSDLVSDNQDDIRNLGKRTENLENTVETFKGTYVDTQRFEETSQGLEKRITYAESDIIELQEDIVIIKEDYATKKYVDDAVASGGVSQEYVDNAIAGLEDDVAYLSTHAATKQYVDDAVASSGGVSQEYVDNAIAGVKDIAENNESDIEFVRQKAVSLETEVENLKESSVTKDYVDSTFTTGETVDRRIEEYDLTVQETYATKKYVDDAVASSGGGTGGGGVSSWNDLTDKPFYDEGTKTVTLDYANPPAVGIDLMGDVLYKVTDDILTEADINSANISLSGTIGGIDTNFSQELNVDTAAAAYPFTFGTVYQFNYEVNGTTVAVTIGAVTQTGAFEEFGMTFNIPETGTYIDCSFLSGEGTINSISLERDGNLKTLDIKFIPNDLYTEIDQRIENYISEALGGEY